MALEIVEKIRPIRRQAMGFKIAHWKRKAVVDPDNRWFGHGQFTAQPLGDASSRPVLARAGRLAELPSVPSTNRRRTPVTLADSKSVSPPPSNQCRCNARIAAWLRILLWEGGCVSCVSPLVLSLGPPPHGADASASCSSRAVPQA